MFRAALTLTALLCFSTSSFAQTAAGPAGSVAAEADVLAYGISGYSGIVSVTLPNKLQVALGAGRYDVPSFLLKGDAHYDEAKWKATVTSIQVARVTYRFRGARRASGR